MSENLARAAALTWFKINMGSYERLLPMVPVYFLEGVRAAALVDSILTWTLMGGTWSGQTWFLALSGCGGPGKRRESPLLHELLLKSCENWQNWQNSKKMIFPYSCC